MAVFEGIVERGDEVRRQPAVPVRRVEPAGTVTLPGGTMCPLWTRRMGTFVRRLSGGATLAELADEFEMSEARLLAVVRSATKLWQEWVAEGSPLSCHVCGKDLRPSVAERVTVQTARLGPVYLRYEDRYVHRERCANRFVRHPERYTVSVKERP